MTTVDSMTVLMTARTTGATAAASATAGRDRIPSRSTGGTAPAKNGHHPAARFSAPGAGQCSFFIYFTQLFKAESTFA